jgi:hypothetical protein
VACSGHARSSVGARIVLAPVAGIASAGRCLPSHCRFPDRSIEGGCRERERRSQVGAAASAIRPCWRPFARRDHRSQARTERLTVFHQAQNAYEAPGCAQNTTRKAF